MSGGFLDTVWLVLDIAKTVLKKELSYHHTQMPLIRPRLIDLGVSGRCLKGVWKMLSQISLEGYHAKTVDETPMKECPILGCL